MATRTAIDTLSICLGDRLAALTALVGARAIAREITDFLLIDVGLVVIWPWLSNYLVRKNRRLRRDQAEATKVQQTPIWELFCKSGTWQRWHADSVLMQSPEWRNYILVAMVESPNGENILRELMPAVGSALQQAPIFFASAR